ncbi:MAG: hypothetical protein WAO78_04190 [Roseovarius sp.]
MDLVLAQIDLGRLDVVTGREGQDRRDVKRTGDLRGGRSAERGAVWAGLGLESVMVGRRSGSAHPRTGTAAPPGLAKKGFRQARAGSMVGVRQGTSGVTKTSIFRRDPICTTRPDPHQDGTAT